jgi:hypothetical protein
VATCANCEKPLEEGDPENLQVLVGELDCSICPSCQLGVLTLKVVLTRDTASDTFRFEQYLPVASAKG